MKHISQRLLNLLIFFVLFSHTGFAAVSDDPAIDDQPLREALSLPDWFKVSFLDIQEDITDARKSRRGLIIYFGQKYCPYCKAHLTKNWARPDIVSYTRANFDVIAIDVRGDKQVTDLDGTEYTEKTFAAHYNATFTPTLLFFDHNGKQALKLSGFRRPYQFRAALEYVTDLHHKDESFREYLARAESAESFGHDTLNESDIFITEQTNLLELIKNKPLAVFFEETRCHACDVLHGGPMKKPAILKQFLKLNAVQLNMWQETPVTTPAGEKTTAKKWADKLELNYAPTIIFYDQTGTEILRVDSVVGFLRLNNVLQFINDGVYRKQPNYLLWREQQTQKQIRN